MGKNNFEGNTVILYGIVLLLTAVAWKILAAQLINDKANAEIRAAYEDDKKTIASIVLYAIGIILAFISSLVGLLFFYIVAVLWIIPDLGLEKMRNQND